MINIRPKFRHLETVLAEGTPGQVAAVINVKSSSPVYLVRYLATGLFSGYLPEALLTKLSEADRMADYLPVAPSTPTSVPKAALRRIEEIGVAMYGADFNVTINVRVRAKSPIAAAQMVGEKVPASWIQGHSVEKVG